MFLSIAYTASVILHMSFFYAKYFSGITFAIFISEFGTPFFSFSRRALYSILVFVVGFNSFIISWNLNFISQSTCVSSIPSRLASFCSISLLWFHCLAVIGVRFWHSFYMVYMVHCLNSVLMSWYSCT